MMRTTLRKGDGHMKRYEAPQTELLPIAGSSVRVHTLEELHDVMENLRFAIQSALVNGAPAVDIDVTYLAHPIKPFTGEDLLKLAGLIETKK